MLIRKAHTGSSSHGHTWHHDGAVLEIPDEHGVELLAVPDGGFTEVQPDEADAAEGPVEEPGPDAEVIEPEPEQPHAVDEAPKPRRGRPPKAKAGEEQAKE